jgi:archaellum component FlaC
MYNTNDILAMLNKGMTADEIAKSFTDSLNAAIKENETNSKKKEKIADAEALMATFTNFMNKYYPNVIELEFNGEDFVEAIDELIPELKKFTQLMEVLAPKEPSTPKENASVDPISYFLKSYNL